MIIKSENRIIRSKSAKHRFVKTGWANLVDVLVLNYDVRTWRLKASRTHPNLKKLRACLEIRQSLLYQRRWRASLVGVKRWMFGKISQWLTLK